MGPLMHEVVGPDMVRPLGAQTADVLGVYTAAVSCCSAASRDAWSILHPLPLITSKVMPPLIPMLLTFRGSC